MNKALFVLMVLATLISCSRRDKGNPNCFAPFLNVETRWADSLLMNMTLEEKVGQLILLKTDLQNETLVKETYQSIQNNYFGGVLLQDLELSSFIQAIDTLQAMSHIPLFVGTQELVALNNQFSKVVQFPLPATLSAIDNDTIQGEMEDLYINQCKSLGINFCFAPSVGQINATDSIYNYQVFEPGAPTLPNRDKKELQLLRANRLLQRLQDEKILSLASPFSDYYEIENDTTGLLDSLLFRHQNLARQGVSGFFMDDAIFQLDSLENYQTFFLKNYMQANMDFDGLMVSEITTEATVDELIHAGTDIFVVKDSAAALFNYLFEFVEAGLMSQKVLNEKVRKILLAKTYAGLNKKPEKIDAKAATDLVDNNHLKYYVRQLFEKSIILAHNHNHLLPFKDTYQRDFKIFQVGNEQLDDFKHYFSKYALFTSHNNKVDTSGDIRPIKTVFYKRSTAVVVLDHIELEATQHQEFIASVNDLSKDSKLTLVNYGNPLNLQFFDTTMVLIQVFEKNKTTESLVPQLLFGGMSAKGSLPLEVTPYLTYRKSTPTKITRLKYTVPQEVGIAPSKLVSIDVIINATINKKATPGCQVLVIKNGKVFYDKAFGHHSYLKRQRIRSSDIYDIASVSKIAATTMVSMLLYDKKKFSLEDRLEKHIALNNKSTVKKIRLRELFTHSSGLQANMPISPFYFRRDTSGLGCGPYFCNDQTEGYNVQLAHDMYLRNDWVDTIWSRTEQLEIKKRGRYRYSDVNFNLIQRVLEIKSRQSLDELLDINFLKPLNLRRTTFNPLKKFKANHIAPTENDTQWRQQRLRGYVHDEAASLLGGVAGNAGLFSNAHDLGILFQVMLNGGVYGDKKYLSPETIKKFTSAKYGNHRGLGFVVKGSRGANSLSSYASRKTYGHTGFTGTCVWVDPVHELIYVFLSNRIHPAKENTRMYRTQVRRRVHDIIYKSLGTYESGRPQFDKIFVDF